MTFLLLFTIHLLLISLLFYFCGNLHFSVCVYNCNWSLLARLSVVVINFKQANQFVCLFVIFIWTPCTITRSAKKSNKVTKNLASILFFQFLSHSIFALRFQHSHLPSHLSAGYQSLSLCRRAHYKYRSMYMCVLFL